MAQLPPCPTYQLDRYENHKIIVTVQLFCKQLEFTVISTNGINLLNAGTSVSLKITRFARNAKIRGTVTNNSTINPLHL